MSTNTRLGTTLTVVGVSTRDTAFIGFANTTMTNDTTNTDQRSKAWRRKSFLGQQRDVERTRETTARQGEANNDEEIPVEVPANHRADA